MLSNWVSRDPMAAQDQQSFVTTIASRYGRRLRRFLAVRLGNAADVPDLALVLELPERPH